MNKTEEIILGMLTENTGIALCDSGRENGRMWQRNQGRDFMAEPESEVEFWIYPDGTFEADQTHNVFHWLRERVEYNEFLDGEFNEYAEKFPDLPWLEIMEMFANENGGHSIFDSSSPARAINTYNYDQMVSQILLYVCWEDGDGDRHVLLQIHGGADVRGGYTAPKVFDLPDFDEYALFDFSKGTIRCPECGEYWDTDDTVHYYEGNEGDGKANLEDYPCEEGEEGKLGVVVITKEHEAFCPKCGKAKLVANYL